MKLHQPFVRLIGSAAVLVLVACGDSGKPNVAPDDISASTPGAPEFVSDVPQVTEAMLQPDFWEQRLSDDRVRMSAQEIHAFNAVNLAGDPYLHRLDEFPQVMPKAAVLALIDTVSMPASSPRVFVDGSAVEEADYSQLEATVQRVEIPEEVTVRWGLVVERASMRSYPTRTRVLKNTGDSDLDRFQETGVFPGQQLAILHESADGEWWFAVNYHYAAWVPKSAVALGDRAAIHDWAQQSLRLTVSGAQVRTNFNPEDARTSEVVLDMGVSLPLLSAAQVGHNVHGQNPFASYIVSLPVRDANGKLAFEPTLIGRGKDVRVGHLPYKPSVVLRQAFKFLGERYGWGHDYNGRDCTGFVGEVYKSFGILMPRNSGQQGKSAFAPTQTFAPDDHEARVKALSSLSVGDLIYIPGHVMMYIGEVDGEPFVIHDVTGLSYYTQDESYYRGTLSGVSVTPLMPLQLNGEKRYIDGIYAIKSII
ncbi:NlpC/P60 family protein [Microbulbifer sp. CAU 1566]|uniref:NlpC/P60 family protein n=1 Tax=Microbulbifer sp. CAU 1566 TaxID=2933269 RepID=UPI002003DA68|nr:NlpC/P60 family protein [Microbulbifer sp. CAU 1566]MCK7597204.1 NlpC/P60 family protein [Microbulbifer sp. CAU 1566]